MVSMLTPSAATSLATTPNASAVMGRPSTTIVWVDGSRSTGMSSLRSIVTSSPTLADGALAPRRAASLPSGHVGRSGDQHPRVSRPADDHLFDVEQVDLRAREHLEERRRHAWLIDPVTVISTDTLRRIHACAPPSVRCGRSRRRDG